MTNSTASMQSRSGDPDEELEPSPRSAPGLLRGRAAGEAPSPRLETGVVESAAPLSVRLGEVSLGARRAKGCLVAPEPGDKVLCALDAEVVYVLSVLEGEGATTRVDVEGALELTARRGRVSVRGAESVDVSGGKAVSITGPKLDVRAADGSVAIDKLGFFGRLVMAEVGKAVVAARELDSLADRVVQRARRVFRLVEEIDQTRAGTVDVRADGLLGLRGESAIVSARVLTKVDAAQIHLG
ncbi:DUF3540 domain-containing protein [Sorangium sp. So ce542]|uniref:DUF3540 domain-containing protein n=1 Tax=Sorangium sp. So ce542 TaxID=3133316 RepID=UPI003F629A5F